MNKYCDIYTYGNKAILQWQIWGRGCRGVGHEKKMPEIVVATASAISRAPRANAEFPRLAQSRNLYCKLPISQIFSASTYVILDSLLGCIRQISPLP